MFGMVSESCDGAMNNDAEKGKSGREGDRANTIQGLRNLSDLGDGKKDISWWVGREGEGQAGDVTFKGKVEPF